MKYNCTVCNYATNDRSNWSRHKNRCSLKSKDEIRDTNIGSKSKDEISSTNTTSKFVCPFCEKSFSSNSCLSRHKLHWCSKNKPDDKDVSSNECAENDDSNKKKNELIKDLIIELKRDKEYFKSLAKKSSEIAEVAVKVAKTAVNALKSIVESYSMQ